MLNHRSSVEIGGLTCRRRVKPMSLSSSNPFLALFEQQPDLDHGQDVSGQASSARLCPEAEGRNALLENVFLFTVNPSWDVCEGRRRPGCPKLIHLKSFAKELKEEQNGRDWLDTDCLDGALFERLHASKSDLQNWLVQRQGGAKSEQSSDLSILMETRVMLYLHGCYRNLISQWRQNRKTVSQEQVKVLKTCIVQQVATALAEPGLYDDDQNWTEQLRQVLESDADMLLLPDVDTSGGENFFTDLLERIQEDGEQSCLEPLVKELLHQILDQLKPLSLMEIGSQRSNTAIMKLLTRHPVTAKMFIDFHFPVMASSNNGRVYQHSLLGCLLTKSCLPAAPSSQQQLDFFEEPSKSTAGAHAATERHIWGVNDLLNQDCFNILDNLLRGGAEVKHLTLTWLGDCIKANFGRSKMWTNELEPFASDGFFLNLGNALVGLCLPICSSKIDRVDASYMGASCVVSEDSLLRHIHLCTDRSKETYLLPQAQDGGVQISHTFNFVTDIFFLTHKVLDIGFRVACEKFMKLNQELGRQQHVYRDIQQQHQNGWVNNEAMQALQGRMDVLMQRFLCMKAALLEPFSMHKRMLLVSATARWLVRIALNESEVKFPLPQQYVSPLLQFIPEFVVETITEHLLLAKRFAPDHLEENGHLLASIFDFILVFMGSRKWIQNPHLRAKLAECMECLLPRSDAQGAGAHVPTYSRLSLFSSHPNRLQLVATVLHVFVDIEMTGQAVEFELKFFYRRPMYEIIKYVWDFDEYKVRFQKLAEYAEQHIDDEDAPLFLRFVNLLINDAIFLLDEALGYMKQIQQLQEQQASWSRLPANERAAQDAQYYHIGRLARYHNLMGDETIGMLVRLTQSIRAVFVHRTMVDRIASMLNYFLKTLVGPGRKSFKVRDVNDYAFTPSKVVTDICRIYVHLSHSDLFLSAVSQDGRSYSAQLFHQAEDVLICIGQAELVPDLQMVAKKVSHLAASAKADDELFSDAPDYFLDPIMSHIMLDPVKLPTSGQVMDRSTIARHLLSDQSDPFTRAPLTMDMVIPMEQLRQEIQVWMEQKRASSSSSVHRPAA